MDDSGNIKFNVNAEFCSDCQSMMRKDGDSWECPDCGATELVPPPLSGSWWSGYATIHVDRLNKDGHGIHQIKDQIIDLGPMQDSAIGAEVTALMINSKKAAVRERDVIADGYTNWVLSTLGERVDMDAVETTVCNDCETEFKTVDGARNCPNCAEFQFQKPSASGLHFAAEIDRFSRSGNGLVKCENGHINLGPIPSSAVATEVTAVRVDSLYAFILDADSETAVNDRNDTGADDEQSNASSRTDGDADRPSVSDGTDDNRESNLRELRHDAQASAADQVSPETTPATSESIEYSRSEAVKRYVKARADGVCEGCRDPAPFTSKTGDPYLHAHHVNELSDGGTDTVDTVIALCPNCHYRVHDGDDGEEYNKKLHSILQEIESGPY